MSEAIYISKKCGIYCHTMRHFYASKMNLIKGSQDWFKVLICDMFDTQLDFAPGKFVLQLSVCILKEKNWFNF